jgi:hypothetical protein
MTRMLSVYICTCSLAVAICVLCAEKLYREVAGRLIANKVLFFEVY